MNRSERLTMLMAGFLLVVSSGSYAAPRMMAQVASTAPVANSRPEPQSGFPTFDVATIKPSSRTVGGMGLGKSSPDTISVANTSARSLIAHAYGVPEWAIKGGPDWMKNTEYDIEAKVLPDDHGVLPQMNLTEIQERIKGLLAQRFGLICHF